MSELRQQQQQQPQQAPIETDQQFQWTCCNPKCSSAVKAIKQQSKPQQQQQQQGQQGDKHESQAGAGPSSNPAAPVAAPVEAAVDDTAQSPGSRQRRKSAKQLECEETDRLLHQVSADPADAADDTAVEAAVSAAVQSRRCAAAGHSVHGDELHCVRGAAELQLKFMLPADLLQDDKEAGSSSTAAVLEQLRKIAEVGRLMQAAWQKRLLCSVFILIACQLCRGQYVTALLITHRYMPYASLTFLPAVCYVLFMTGSW